MNFNMQDDIKNNESTLTDDNIELVPDEILPFLDNPFVDDFHGNSFVYTKDFYVAMYKKIHDEGMTYVEAYNALGFDTKVLGENRATSIGKRVMKLAKKNRLFTVDPANYDGSVPREEMGNLSPEEELAYFKARNLYLESIIEAQKKIPSILEDVYTYLKQKK